MVRFIAAPEITTTEGNINVCIILNCSTVEPVLSGHPRGMAK